MALLEDTRTLTRGHLRVAADSASHVMPLLAELKRQHGGLTFSLRIGNSSDVLQQVLDYAADVAVTAKQTSDPRIHSVLLRRDTLVVFVPSGHPWAARGHISMAELNGQELVIRERGSITREVFEARMAEAGVKPAALVEVQAREAVREAVVAGFGIGIMLRQRVRAGPRMPQAHGAGRGTRGGRVHRVPGGAAAHSADPGFLRRARAEGDAPQGCAGVRRDQS